MFTHPSPVAARLQELAHIWVPRLRNTVSWETESWCDAASRSDYPPLGSEKALVNELRQLTPEFEDAYAPIQLVNAGPLLQIRDDVRELIREGLHKAYCKAHLSIELRDRFSTAVDDFSRATHMIAQLWPNERDVSFEKAVAAFNTAAEELASVLENLPRGVLIP